MEREDYFSECVEDRITLRPRRLFAKKLYYPKLCRYLAQGSSFGDRQKLNLGRLDPMRKQREINRLTEEERAFMDSLYEAHKKTMYYAAFRECHDPDIANDLMQECWINLIKNISTIQKLDCCKIDAYIVIAIRRLYINYAKKESRATLLPIDQPFIATAVDEKSAELELEKEAAKQTVKDLLDQLSPRDQLILQSKYILGLNEEEIAAAVGCKPNSVRTLISRARERAKAIGLKSEKGDEKENG